MRYSFCVSLFIAQLTRDATRENGFSLLHIKVKS
ncbi:MAG: hypothetical protein ACI8RD_011657 [Bacillariaceae sp.]